MNIKTALQRADEWTDGATFHEHSEGWRAAIAVLAAALRQSNMRIADLRAERDRAYTMTADQDAQTAELKARIEQLHSELQRLRECMGRNSEDEG